MISNNAGRDNPVIADRSIVWAGSCRTLLEGNPSSGFPSNDRFALCLLSMEHSSMNFLPSVFRGVPFATNERRIAAREESKGESLPWSQGGTPRPRRGGRERSERWKGETRSGFPLQGGSGRAPVGATRFLKKTNLYYGQGDRHQDACHLISTTFCSFAFLCEIGFPIIKNFLSLPIF